MKYHADVIVRAGEKLMAIVKVRQAFRLGLREAVSLLTEGGTFDTFEEARAIKDALGDSAKVFITPVEENPNE